MTPCVTHPPVCTLLSFPSGLVVLTGSLARQASRPPKRWPVWLHRTPGGGRKPAFGECLYFFSHLFIFLHLKFLLKMSYIFFFPVSEWKRTPRRPHTAQAQRSVGQSLWVGRDAPGTSLGCVSLTAMYSCNAVPSAGGGGESVARLPR